MASTEDGAADPDGVLAFGGRDDLHLHGGGRECLELLLHAFRDAREHCRPATHHHVPVELLADVHVALHYRLVGRLVDAGRLDAHQRGLKQRFRAAIPLGPDRNHLAVLEGACRYLYV